MLIGKICLLGEGAVGKTAIRERYLSKKFTSNYLMTVGADFAVKELSVEYNGQVYQMKFQIWDLAGQPRFNSVREIYYKGAVGGLLVFDVTRPESFESLNGWLTEFFKNNDKGHVPIIVIGNKIDLRDQYANALPPESGMQFVENIKKVYPDIKAQYIETSAKTGENIEKAFNNLALAILESSLQKKLKLPQKAAR